VFKSIILQSAIWALLYSNTPFSFSGILPAAHYWSIRSGTSSKSSWHS